MENFEKKVNSATKWSAITTIFRKLISPITNMILARLLVPEVFGVVATINIVISFADIFTDAGFQKFLIQREFQNENKLYNSANVAFWTNFLLSMLVWLLIFVFKDSIADLVGSSGYGFHLSIAALSIPLLSFSSIQQAIFKRNFDFKGMFFASFMNTLIPLLVTIPVAYFTRSCWSLIIGTLCANLSDAVLLTFKSKWKPSFYYSFNEFKEMFGFSFWTLLERLSIWLTLNVDTFILGHALSKRNLGIYKTSLTTVNQISNLVTTIIIPVLFSTLSRMQNDDKQFKQEFNLFQRKSGFLLIPLSIGIFVYRDLVTIILLGKQWMDGAFFIGMIGLTQACTILISNFASEVYRAKGEPKVSFWVQIIYVFILSFIIYLGSKSSFQVLCILKVLCSFVFALLHVIVLRFRYNFNIISMFNNVKHSIIASLIMGIVGTLAQLLFNSMFLKMITVLICIIVYFMICMIFDDTRQEILSYVKKVKFYRL